MANELRGRRSQSLAALERDAALGRIGRTRRWAIVGATGLTAGFAALVSAVAPGKSLSHIRAGTVVPRTGTATTHPRSTDSTKMPPLASPSALGLQSPGQAPGGGSDPSQAAPSDPSQSAPSQAAAPAPTPAPVQQAPAPVVSGGS